MKNSKRTAPKKLPQELQDAQWRLNSAVVRGVPKDELERLRNDRDAVMDRLGIPKGQNES